MAVDRRDIRWAAGLFEGEGWASLDTHKRSYGRGVYAYTVAGLSTTDEDVARTFTRIMGGKLFGPYENKRGVKQLWTWKVRNAEARRALQRLLPYMGERRSAQIKAALNDSIPARHELSTPL